MQKKDLRGKESERRKKRNREEGALSNPNVIFRD